MNALEELAKAALENRVALCPEYIPGTTIILQHRIIVTPNPYDETIQSIRSVS